MSLFIVCICLPGEVAPNEENIKASIEAVVTKARQEAVEQKEESDESQSSSSNSSSSDSDSSGSKYIHFASCLIVDVCFAFPTHKTVDTCLSWSLMDKLLRVCL